MFVDDELEKQIEDNFKTVEFNNPIEDNEVMNEENNNYKNEMNQKKRKTIFIIIGVIVLLIIAVLFFVFSGKSSNNEENSSDNNGNNNENNNQENNGVIPYSGVDTIFGEYIYNSSNGVIKDLDGKEIARADSGFNLVKGQNTLYEVKFSDKNVKVKAFESGKFNEILDANFDKSDNKGLVVNTKNSVVGVYFDTDYSSILYIFGNSGAKRIDLKDKFIYTHALGADEDKYVYDDNIIVTINEENLYGLYDINKDKEVVSPSYKVLHYMGSKKYVAVKDDKAGIIDKNGKVLLDFKYMFIEKDGNYYLAGKDNKLIVLDSNYKEIGAELEIINLDKYEYVLCCMNKNPFTAYNFNNNLIVQDGGYGPVDFYYLDKNNNFVELAKEANIELFDNYLLVLKDEIITVYDKNMKEVSKITLESDEYFIKTVFLNSVVIFEKLNDSSNHKFYNINTGEELKTISTFRRTYSGYEVKFIVEKDNKGTLIISKDEEELGKLLDASFDAYITAPNNGITITEDKIIYNANNGDILVVEKN